MLLSLPQETVNEIIAYLRSDERALQSLSVVAKRLTDECRCHLFASVHIYSRAKLIRWCEAISPGEDGLSRYVRTLNFDTSDIVGIVVANRPVPPFVHSSGTAQNPPIGFSRKGEGSGGSPQPLLPYRPIDLHPAKGTVFGRPQFPSSLSPP